MTPAARMRSRVGEPSMSMKQNHCHCERSEAISHRIVLSRWRLLRRCAPRNDKSLFRGPLIPDSAVLDRCAGDQPLLRGHRIAVAVGHREIAVAALQQRNIGIGAGLERTDRALITEDPRWRGGG